MNDLCLVPENDRTVGIISASSDRSIKLWRPEGPHGVPTNSYTMRHHTDFVKALAFAEQVWHVHACPPRRETVMTVLAALPTPCTAQARLLASAGCDSTVLLWDLQTLAPCGCSGGEGACHTDSIYALATNPTATLVP